MLVMTMVMMTMRDNSSADYNVVRGGDDDVGAEDCDSGADEDEHVAHTDADDRPRGRDGDDNLSPLGMAEIG